MSKELNKETLQILVVIVLLIGLLVSLGFLVWMSFPNKRDNNQQVNPSEELLSNFDSSERTGPLVVKLNGNFLNIPRSNSTLKFVTNEGQVYLQIPSDFPSNFKMNSIEATVHYLGTTDNKRVFQLLKYSSTNNKFSDAWTSRIKPKKRIRSSDWYYF